MSTAWLDGPRRLERIRPVLASLAPNLIECKLEPVLRQHEGALVPSETVLIGGTHALKVAWTAEHAIAIRRHRGVLQALKNVELPVPVPAVKAATTAPESFLYELLPGTTRLTWEIGSALLPAETIALADDWAALIAALQEPATLAAVQAAEVTLLTRERAEPREQVAAIRAGLLPLREEAWLPPLLDLVEATLAVPAARHVLLHADLGGHNLLVSHGAPRLCGLIDFEQAAVGDPAFDLRNLLSQADSPRLCREVIEHLEVRTGQEVDRQRVLAYNICLDLGDIAGRIADGRPVVGGVEARMAAIPGRLAAARSALGI